MIPSRVTALTGLLLAGGLGPSGPMIVRRYGRGNSAATNELARRGRCRATSDSVSWRRWVEGLQKSFVVPVKVQRRDATRSRRHRGRRWGHIGDAVPPMISYQLVGLSKWMLTDRKPSARELILSDCHLTADDVEQTLTLW
jgi:hypothetical protein